MTLARMTRGTTIATVSVDMVAVAVAEEEAATRIAGLVGMMKDAMMKDAMTTGVMMNAAMTNGGTEVDEGVVGRMPDVPACLGPFDSVHNPSIVDSPSIPSLPFGLQCVSANRPSTTHPPSRSRS